MSDKQKDNLKLWNAVEETDPSKTKKAKLGSLTLTAINATSQIKQATKHWGMYGSTWGLKNINYEYMDIEKTRLAIVRAMFYYPEGEFEISTSIKVYYMTQGANGYLKIDDDFLKKAETDLTTKSLSKLGFNADVFMGLYDDNKYLTALKEKYAEEKTPKTPELKKLSESVFKKMKVSDNLDSLKKSLTKYKLDDVQKSAIEKRILEIEKPKTPIKTNVKLKKITKAFFVKMSKSDNLDSLKKSLTQYELDEVQESTIKKRILELQTPPPPIKILGELKKLTEAVKKKMLKSKNIDSLRKAKEVYILDVSTENQIKIRIEELIKEKNGKN